MSSVCRIGLVGPLPPPEGGIANQTRSLGEALLRDGFAVEWIRTNTAYRPAVVGKIKGVRALFRLFPLLLALWRAAARVDVLHVMANSGWSWHLFAVPAVVIGRLRAVRTIVNFRGGSAEDFLRRQRALVAPQLRLAAAIVVPSQYLARVFAAFGLVTEVIPNFVATERFHPPAVARTSGAEPKILIARNLEPIYDVATGLRAFGRVLGSMPSARLAIAGEGPERERLVRLATDLGIAPAVTFLGRVAHDAVATLYRESDVLLNTSLVDNMPNSLIEAQASGLPIVSTRAGGIPFFVRDGVTGLLADCGNDAELAGAALRLLMEPELHERIAAAGLAAAAAYTWPRVRGGWLRVYGIATAANPVHGGAAA